LTDTHCHLDFMEPAEQAQALADCSGFKAILNIGTNPERNQTTLALAETYPHIWSAVGLHPIEAEHLPAAMAQLSEQVHHPRVRAVGETGLDFYWTPETKTAQYKALDFQQALAEPLGLPLVFHVRSKDASAELELTQWLRENKPKKLVLHAFGGHPDLVEIGLELGAYFSFAGPLTYKNNQALRQVAQALPLDKLLIETDAPFLPPEPHRGKRNHPALVAFTLAKLAEVRGISAKDLEAITDTNTVQCFSLT
jgi:TatD DNase family protein